MGNKLKETKSRIPQVVTTAEAKNALMEWIESSTMKYQQGQVTAGIIRWFLKQEPFVQTAVLGAVDVGMEHAYAAALRKLADELFPIGQTNMGESGDAFIPKQPSGPANDQPSTGQPLDRPVEGTGLRGPAKKSK